MSACGLWQSLSSRKTSLPPAQVQAGCQIALRDRCIILQIAPAAGTIKSGFGWWLIWDLWVILKDISRQLKDSPGQRLVLRTLNGWAVAVIVKDDDDCPCWSRHSP